MRITTLCILCASVVFLTGESRGAEKLLSSLIDLAPGQLGLYEGKTLILQTLGSSAPSTTEWTSSLSYLVLSDDKPGDRRLLLLRSVTPQANGLPMPPYSHTGFFWLRNGLDLTPVEETLLSPQLQVLDRHVPPSFLPLFTLPDSAEVVREESVRLTGALVVLPLKVSVDRKGKIVTVTRTLAPGSAPTVDLDGATCVVQIWQEVHVIDTEKRVLTEMRREFKASGKRGEHALSYSQKMELSAREVRALTGAEAKYATEADREIAGIFSDFAGKKHPRDVYQRIQSFVDGPQAKLLPGLEDSLLSRLSQYRQARDQEARGTAQAAAVYDAPDFSLENLEGKMVAFREATRGKVVLLSFWGYGCGPCRIEAPYLSKLQEKYGDKGFVVFAVNGYDEDKETVQGFVSQQNLKQPVFLMGRNVAREKYKVSGFPTNFWIDHQGKVVHKEVGFSPDYFPAMEARVKKLLQGSVAAALEAVGK